MRDVRARRCQSDNPRRRFCSDACKQKAWREQENAPLDRELLARADRARDAIRAGADPESHALDRRSGRPQRPTRPVPSCGRRRDRPARLRTGRSRPSSGRRCASAGRTRSGLWWRGGSPATSRPARELLLGLPVDPDRLRPGGRALGAGAAARPARLPRPRPAAREADMSEKKPLREAADEATAELGQEYGRLRLRRLSEVRSRTIRFLVPGLCRCGHTRSSPGSAGSASPRCGAVSAAGETRGDYGEDPPTCCRLLRGHGRGDLAPAGVGRRGRPGARLRGARGARRRRGVVLPEDISETRAARARTRGPARDHRPDRRRHRPRLDTHKDQHVRSVLGRLRHDSPRTRTPPSSAIGHLNKDARQRRLPPGRELGRVLERRPLGRPRHAKTRTTTSAA